MNPGSRMSQPGPTGPGRGLNPLKRADVQDRHYRFCFFGLLVEIGSFRKVVLRCERISADMPRALKCPASVGDDDASLPDAEPRLFAYPRVRVVGYFEE
jgi:hypothetical protein